MFYYYPLAQILKSRGFKAPMDLQQAVAIVIGIAALILWNTVFLANDTFSEHRTVSTSLFHSAACRWGMTGLVCAQLIMVSLFVWRYRNVAYTTTLFAAAAVTMALIGWCLVVACDPLTQEASHLVGSALFSAGTCAYNIGLLRLAFRFDAPDCRWKDIATACVMIIDIVLAIVYLSLFFASRDEFWIFQNLTLLVAFIVYTVFFWFHPFNPLPATAYAPLSAHIVNM